jgi:hypothetical protein
MIVMALLEEMPKIHVAPVDLFPWGKKWLQLKKVRKSGSIRKVAECFTKKQGMDFGRVFDESIGKAFAAMLGGVAVSAPGARALLPIDGDSVEVGHVRVVGGIRPQNYDVGYRPDGVRFVHDTKTLNDTASVGKNFQNMINDLGTEATTLHTRFPYAVVTFLIAIPEPCFRGETRKRFTRMLDRLVGRRSPIDLAYKAEAMSLLLWNPQTGEIDPAWPPPESPLRIDHFAEQIEAQYHERYDGMPPHDQPSDAQRSALKKKGEVIAETSGSDVDDIAEEE